MLLNIIIYFYEHASKFALLCLIPESCGTSVIPQLEVADCHNHKVVASSQLAYNRLKKCRETKFPIEILDKVAKRSAVS